MARVNDLGEIIRDNNTSSSSGTDRDTPLPPSDNSGCAVLIFLALIALVLFVIFSNLRTCGESSIAQVESSDKSTNNTESLTDYATTSTTYDTTTVTVENPYGAGNGKLTLYKTCNTCPELNIDIDGTFTGSLSEVFDKDYPPSCDDNGTLSVVLAQGNHSVHATDSHGEQWNFDVNVPEGECETQGLSKDNDNKANPFGTGNGKLTIYKTCNYCPNLEVSVDGNFVGTLSETFNNESPPSCDDYGTISKVLPTGQHNISAKDDYRTTWNFPVTVAEGECATKYLWKKDDRPLNPYGYNNGQITIYHTCSNCSNVKVYIDGVYQGTLIKYYPSSTPTCGNVLYGSVIVQNLTTGYHTISATDDNDNTWTGTPYISDAVCTLYSLENMKEVNPFGYGKGEVSFWTSDNTIYDLYIDGTYQGTMRNRFFQKPNCSQNGTLTYTIDQGSHSFMAKGYANQWSGYFSVIKGKCSIVKINQ